MKKLLFLIILLAAIILPNTARADIFGDRPKPEEQPVYSISGGSGSQATYATKSESVINAGDATIIEHAHTIIDYLGAREGAFYDFKSEEFCNYLAATIYTYKPAGISFNFGMLNLDGIAATVDWNVGASIPSQDVPVLSLFQYLYVGGGIGGRNLEKNDDGSEKAWQAAYGLDVQFKFTY